jgi:multiple sugar transport system substrate-binding protein
LKTTHRFIPIVLVFLVLMLLSGAIVQAQEVSLTYYAKLGGEDEDKERELLAICEEELGVTVDIVVSDDASDMMIQIRALATAGEMPDVFWMSSGFIDEFAADGLLLNVQEYVDRDIMPQADEYFVASFDAGRWPDKSEGDIYAFTNHFVETILYYDIDAFDAAGLDYPSTGWSWDDFLAAAQALTVDENDDGLIDQYGHVFYGRYANIESWVYQNGGRWLNSDKTEFAPTDSAIDAVMFLDSLIDEHGVAPTPAEMEGLGKPFLAGLSAMWVDGAWYFDDAREAGINFGIGPVPRGPLADGDTAYGWSDMTAVGATTEHPDEAWALVECLTGPNRTVDLVQAGKIPVYRSVAMSDEWLELDQLPANKAFLLEWADNIGPTSFTPGWGEWRGYTGGAGLQGTLDEAFNGNMTIEEAVAAAGEVASEVLDRYYGD